MSTDMTTTAVAIARMAELAATVDRIARTPGPTRDDASRAHDLLFDARDIDRRAGKLIPTHALAEEYSDTVRPMLSTMASNARAILSASLRADEERLVNRAFIPTEDGQVIVSVFPDRAQVEFDDGPRKRVEHLTRDQAAAVAAALTGQFETAN